MKKAIATLALLSMATLSMSAMAQSGTNLQIKVINQSSQAAFILDAENTHDLQGLPTTVKPLSSSLFTTVKDTLNVGSYGAQAIYTTKDKKGSCEFDFYITPNNAVEVKNTAVGTNIECDSSTLGKLGVVLEVSSYSS